MSSSCHRRPALRLTAGILMAAVAASTLSSRPDGARAGDEKSTCITLYEHSQVLRRDHLFSRAREELRGCSRMACPALVRNDCLSWLDQVQTSMPSLAIHALKDGSDVANVRVSLDEQVIATHLDGSSLEVDPGEHTFQFETEGAPPVVLKLVVRENEKDRAVPITFASTREATTAPSTSLAASRPVPVGVFVLGGIGVAGLAAFGALGVAGRNDQNAMTSTCAPNCSQGSIDQARTEYIAADVALGVGAAALASAGIWLLLRPEATEGGGPARESVGLTPRRDGASLDYVTRF